MSSFDGDTGADLQRQNRLLVVGVLRIEHAGARHRDNAHLATLLGQLVVSLNRQTHFRTGGDQDQLRLACAVLQHVTATGDLFDLDRVAGLVLQVLTREDQGRRTVVTFQGELPGHCRFNGIGSRFGVLRRLVSCSIGW